MHWSILGLIPYPPSHTFTNMVLHSSIPPQPTGSLLVLLEEDEGYPLGVSVDTVSITKVCGHVSDSHLPPALSWRKSSKKHHRSRSKVQLVCPPGRNVSRILFASFGTPYGDCDSYAVGSCHLPHSRAIIEKDIIHGFK